MTRHAVLLVLPVLAFLAAVVSDLAPVAGMVLGNAGDGSLRGMALSAVAEGIRGAAVFLAASVHITNCG